MSETKNYGLYLEEDAGTKFIVWRKKINDATNSNMTIIDEVLGGKAARSAAVELTLSASDWTGVNAPYSQTLSVNGLAEDTNGVVGVAMNLTTEQLETVYAAELAVSAQADGALTIIANGDKPTYDIPIVLILLG